MLTELLELPKKNEKQYQDKLLEMLKLKLNLLKQRKIKSMKIKFLKTQIISKSQNNKLLIQERLTKRNTANIKMMQQTFQLIEYLMLMLNLKEMY